MKRIKKLAAMLAAVAILALLPDANVVTAEAAEPVTYAVKYVSDELGWRFQPYTNQYDDTAGGGQISTLRQDIKDGDVVVIENRLGANTSLDLGSVKLSNLTYLENTKFSIVYAGGVTDCYVLGGTTGTVNCDVENAYVYDTVVFNFNGNVKEMTITAGDKLQSSVGTEGTVGHLYAYSTSKAATLIDCYDFAAGALYIQNGIFLPKGSYVSAVDHAAALAAQSTATSNSSSSDDEYDDVPQTGQNSLYLWLLGASWLCFAGSHVLRRPER